MCDAADCFPLCLFDGGPNTLSAMKLFSLVQLGRFHDRSVFFEMKGKQSLLIFKPEEQFGLVCVESLSFLLSS